MFQIHMDSLVLPWFYFCLQTNTFQCVLATNGVESYVIFLYADGRIRWTTGDNSGGFRGLGGTEALAGINAGDGVEFVTIPRSLTTRIINIDKTSNVGTPGIWMFKVNAGSREYNVKLDTITCRQLLSHVPHYCEY